MSTVALLLQRKRERENNNTLHGHGASTSGKKYNNEPSSSKKYKKTDPDSEDVSDEVILKAIKRINESNYANKTEVTFFCKTTMLVKFHIQIVFSLAHNTRNCSKRRR